jgi:hypothetical protein
MSLPAPSIEHAKDMTVERDFLLNCTVLVEPSVYIQEGDILHVGMVLKQGSMFIRNEFSITSEQVIKGVRWKLLRYTHVAMPREAVTLEYRVERANETVGRSEIAMYMAK